MIGVALAIFTFFHKFVNTIDLTHQILRNRIFGIFEDVFHIKKTFVNEFGSLVIFANDKNLCRLVSGGFGLGSLNGFEEFVEDPNEGLVIGRSEDFGDEPATSA